MATLFEENRAKWAAAYEGALCEWGKWRRYSYAINFVIKFVPDMLAQIDADTETIERQYGSRSLAGATQDLVACAEILASLEESDKGRRFPTKEECATARAALAKADGAS